MDELDHEKVIKKIIFKELEPSVLNEDIISRAIYDQGPDGEAGKLFRKMEIQYDKISVLRLEFLNILKIDHLWILPNLQVLSLAFNKIDKIENLEALGGLKELNLTYNSITKLENFEGLISLEILNVFGNQIKIIENVDCLDNLIIFSAGNNLIETTDGLERLRFLKNLRSLNLKGNAVEKGNKFFRIYIAGLLPDLVYYEYKHISKEQRDEGKDRFRFKLRDIMDNEKAEVYEREHRARDRENNIHLTACFVEDFDQHQLFDSLFCFENEDQGQCLLNIGEEEKNLIAEFHDQSFVITQKIYNIGLEQFELRKAEQKLFMNCVTIGKKKIQVQGQKIIENFFTKSDAIFTKLREVADAKDLLDDEQQQTEASKSNFAQTFALLSKEFNDLHDQTWQILMDNEMHLHEAVIDSNWSFEHVIQDMMNEFMEQCKTEFVQLREVESNFIDALTEAVQSFVTSMASSGKEDEIPEALRASLNDRDIIYQYAAGMREMHMRKIDSREDLLVNRCKQWVQQLCDQMMLFENERNRRKVMEINYFLDNQSMKFEELSTEIGGADLETVGVDDAVINFEEIIADVKSEIPLDVVAQDVPPKEVQTEEDKTDEDGADD